MDAQAALAQVIDVMLSQSDERQAAEQQFWQILRAEPLFVLSFLVDGVVSPGPVVNRNAVLLHYIFRDEDLLEGMDPGVYAAIRESTMRILFCPALNSPFYSLLVDVIGEFVVSSIQSQLWSPLAELIPFLCSNIQDLNSRTSRVCIWILALVIPTVEEIPGEIIEFCMQLITSACMDDAYTTCIGSVVSLIMNLWGIVGDNMRAVAPGLVHKIALCPVEDAEGFSSAIERLGFIFFQDVIGDILGVLGPIIMNREYPGIARAKYMDFVQSIATRRFKYILPFIQNWIPVAMSCIAEKESGNEYLIYTAKLFLLSTSKEGTAEIDAFVIDLIGRSLAGDPAARYSGMSTLQCFVEHLSWRGLVMSLPIIQASLSDGIPACRAVGFRVIRRMFSTFEDELSEGPHAEIVPVILDVLRQESDGKVMHAGLKAIRTFCSYFSSDIVAQYAPAILDISVMQGNPGALTENLCMAVCCIKELANTLGSDFAPCFPAVSQMMAQLLQSQEQSVRYNAIITTPCVCKSVDMEVSGPLAIACAQVYHQTPLEFYSDSERTEMIHTMRKLVKMGVPKECINFVGMIEQLMAVITSPLCMMSEKEGTDLLDYEFTPLRLVADNGSVAVMNMDVINCIKDAFDEFTNFIDDFAEEFIPIAGQLATVVRDKFLVIPDSESRCAILRCLDLLIKHADIYGLPVVGLLSILDNHMMFGMVARYATDCLKRALKVEQTPAVFAAVNVILQRLVSESRERRAKLIEQDQDSNDFLSDLEYEDVVEHDIAKVFAYILKVAGPSLGPEYVSGVATLFDVANKDTMSDMAIMCIHTQVAVMTGQNIPGVAEFCIQHFPSEHDDERQAAAKYIGVLASSVPFEPGFTPGCLAALSHVIADTDEDFSDAREEAACALLKIISTHNELHLADVIEQCFGALSILKDSSLVIRGYHAFANLICSSPQMFLGTPEYMVCTLKMVSRSLSKSISEETQDLMKTFITNIRSDPQTVEYVDAAIRQLSEKAQSRLVRLMQ